VLTERVTLRHLAGGAPAAAMLHEPSGRDEMSVEGVDTRAAVALLERLLQREPFAPVPPAARLAACDRDALLAALHRHLWGDRIRATLTCANCGQRFDLSFELSAIQRHLAGGASAWLPDGSGCLSNAGGHSYRVPTAEDEIAVVAEGARAAAALAARCGVAPEHIESAAAALEAGAPILDLDLDACCIECGHRQLTHFDLQSFLLQRILNERPALLAEIHLLADGYGWSLRETLSLARRTRRSLATIAGDARRGAAA